MSPDATLDALMLTAVAVGFFHTLFGPDHYLPFVVMAKARKWSGFKTAWITFLCGLGHVGSSVVLGLVGVALGIAVGRLTDIEGHRGAIAAWLLIGFGLAYGAWGLRRALKNRPHTHIHAHVECDAHEHTHDHHREHVHVHDHEKPVNLTPWVLFTIFVLGPCEPLIPILMYPAAMQSYGSLFLISGLFAAVTIATMLTVVLLASWGISFLPLKRIEPYTHALAGASIALCGLAIVFLGL